MVLGTRLPSRLAAVEMSMDALEEARLQPAVAMARVVEVARLALELVLADSDSPKPTVRRQTEVAFAPVVDFGCVDVFCKRQ